MGNGRQSLNMSSQQPREQLGLGFAQLRELRGHMRHRTVVLADLLAARSGAYRRGETVACERLGQDVRAVSRRGGRYQVPVPVLDLAGTTAGELRDCVRPGRLAQETQSADRESVIGLLEGVTAAVGEPEDLGWATSSSDTVDVRLASFQRADGDQVVEVASNRSGGEVESVGQRSGRGRSVVENRPCHPLPRRRVADRLDGGAGPGRGRIRLQCGCRPLRAFHNTIVP